MRNDPQTSPAGGRTPTLSDLLRTASRVERQQEWQRSRPSSHKANTKDVLARHLSRFARGLAYTRTRQECLMLILPLGVILWIAWHSLGP
jgi:hypothetical protein